MISSLGGGSEYVQVSNGYSNIPYVSPNSSIPMMGAIRLNGQNLEVFNGSTWVMMTMGYPMVDVSDKTKEILRWAESKMHSEREIMNLVKDNPTVADAYKTYQEAADKLAVVMKLVQE